MNSSERFQNWVEKDFDPDGWLHNSSPSFIMKVLYDLGKLLLWETELDQISWLLRSKPDGSHVDFTSSEAPAAQGFPWFVGEHLLPKAYGKQARSEHVTHLNTLHYAHEMVMDQGLGTFWQVCSS